jgi:hypothetical protein
MREELIDELFTVGWVRVEILFFLSRFFFQGSEGFTEAEGTALSHVLTGFLRRAIDESFFEVVVGAYAGGIGRVKA